MLTRCISCGVVYLGRKVYLRDGNRPPVTYSSKFGEEVRDCAVRFEQRHEWKRLGPAST